MNGRLWLGRKNFVVRCERLRGGLLFQKKSMSEDFEKSFKGIDVNTIYYAVDGAMTPYKEDHPLCDLYFKTANGELVVFDVTAFNDAELVKANLSPGARERNQMIDWVKSNRTNYNKLGITLHDIVLAMLTTSSKTLMWGIQSQF
jgi:hypothetical protein